MCRSEVEDEARAEFRGCVHRAGGKRLRRGFSDLWVAQSSAAPGVCSKARPCSFDGMGAWLQRMAVC